MGSLIVILKCFLQKEREHDVRISALHKFKNKSENR